MHSSSTDEIEGKWESFYEITRMLNNEYCSSVSMETIARELQNLYILRYETDDTSGEVPVEPLAKEIHILEPQAPQDCRTE